MSKTVEIHMYPVTDTAMEARARRAAKRLGLKAQKSRELKGTIQNRGGFRLVDEERDFIWAGRNYDCAAEGVIECCGKIERGKAPAAGWEWPDD